MTKRLLFGILVVVFFCMSGPFSSYMKSRPLAIKLGYIPEAEAMKLVAGDQRYLVGEIAVLKVLFYYGSLMEKLKNRVVLAPEYPNMFKTIQTAVKLDPYNMDAYYFAQAAFTWEVGRVREVNSLLAYGMKYRTWDYSLPFYAGFNSAYFLKDYQAAAGYMKKAAQLSGEPLLTNLSARYFYESGQDDLAIRFLSEMERGAKDKKIRAIYEIRKRALLAAKALQEATERYRMSRGRLPADVRDLVAGGFIDRIPADPYGGTFYLAPDGKIRTTSKFAFRSGKQ